MNSQPFVELDLESQIDWNAHQLATALTPEERRTAWDRLRQLHALRTKERVESMEVAAGLR